MEKRRLIVVDDNPEFGAIVRKVADPAGFDTMMITNPKRFWERPEIRDAAAIILDLQMPGADGVVVLRELASTGCTTPILLSSGVDAKVLDSAHRLGIDYGLSMIGPIAKPVRVSALLDILTNLPGPKPTLTVEGLSAGMAADELTVHFQPQMDITTRRIVSAEALVRWQHPELGLLAPDQFIALAESGDAIVALTDRVLDIAIGECGKWRVTHDDLGLSINVSARIIDDVEMPDRIAALCLRHRVPPAAVTLELTETASSQEPTKMMDVLTRFRLKGFRLSIDDFGTGYSSLSQLQRLPFSELKIDKAFVTRMATAKDCRIIAHTVIGMGHNLDMKVVAEGVEDKEALAILADDGCDLAQGYYISRALRADKIPRFVRQRDLVQ